MLESIPDVAEVRVQYLFFSICSPMVTQGGAVWLVHVIRHSYKFNLIKPANDVKIN